MPSFIHTADWQIGRQYGQFDDEETVPLAQACQDAVAVIARLALASDADMLAAELETLGEPDVLRPVLTGEISVVGWTELEATIDRAAARIHALRLDTAGVAVVPDEDDLAAVAADGYVGQVAAELNALHENLAQGATARNALYILLQVQRHFAREPGRAP